jgi:putative flippase GtrA
MLAKKDYYLVAFIGFCFGIFLIPVLANIDIGIDLSLPVLSALVVVSVLFAVLALWVSGLIAKKIPVVLQLAKFAAVGTFNTLLDAAVLNVLIYLTAVASGLGFTAFKGVSFITANIASYFWNRYWTFSASGKATTGEFGKFFGVSVVGLALNIGVASLIVNVMGAPAGVSLERWANVGFIVATLASLAWNFVGYKFFVFIGKKGVSGLDNSKA